MASKRDLTVKRRRGAAARETEPEEAVTAQETEPAKAKKKKKKRRRRPRSVVWLALSRLALVAVLVGAGVLIWRNWDRLAPAALSEWLDRVVTGGEGGDGYPVAITGSDVVAIQPMDNRVAVLTNTSLLMYNTNGGEVVSRGHTYSAPTLDTAGSYALVSEVGGTRYMLGTKKETVRSGEVGNAILGAAVDADGQVALATESSRSYMSEVVVFDRSGQESFHWYSADLTVVDVALSANGKRVAVLGLSAENGEMVSTLMIFSLSGGTTAEASYRAAGAMMGALRFYGADRVGAVGDTAAWMYDMGRDECVVTAYEDASLLGYTFSDKGIGLVTRGYGESSGGVLTLLSASGTQTAALSFTGDFRHLAAADNGFYLLTSDTLYNADTTAFVRQAAVAADGLQVAEMNGRPLVLGLTALTRCEWE